MTYNVQVGSGGYTGWKTLERTMARQRQAFSQDTSIKSAQKYFSEKMPSAKSADDLIGDYRLLTVALRAFGLDSDINNRFFIKKVLESDPNDESSLVNRLADKRYLNLNQAMKVGGAETPKPVDVEAILTNYDTRSFEKNIGERHSDIELALNAQRELPQIAAADISENAKWYQILGSKSLRKIFEVSYGLGNSFAALPIDRQLTEIKAKTAQFSGSDSASQFESITSLDSMLRRYLLRSQIVNSSINSSHVSALTLLRM
ncbi:DUF1217 domain-containing protein [Paracoccus aminovorans]|uniref:DUF1217 domain-containing protein n=1 Tax=Paracoccus aminovorans TaxID=34004 RepID=UPI002B25CE2A|nr:DUF1217 domain-containing protein [Paracoccus aminovorans]